MLDEKVIQDQTAIEELFCKPFEKLKQHNMDNETSGLMIQLLMGNPQEIPEKEKPFLLKLIEKRIEVVFDYVITDIKLLLFLCVLTETPGKAVMYLTYLQYWAKKNSKFEIDMDTFCQTIFPWGFPSDEDLDKLWDSQKVKTKGMSDNLVDYPLAMQSLLISETIV